MWDALFFSLFFLLNFLHVNSYPLWRIESLALGSCLFLPAASLGWITDRTKQRWFYYASLFAISADLGWGAGSSIKAALGPVGLVLSVFFFLYLAYRSRRSLPILFRVWVAVSTLSALCFFVFFPESLYTTRGRPPGAHPNNGQPNIYFIVLDEHAGFNGWPSGAFYDDLKKEIRDRYEKRGFSIYENNNANFCATMDSIPSILNDDIPVIARSKLKGKSLKTNRLFKKFSAEGYGINVYQSTHLDYCDGQTVEKCFVYKESSAGYVKTTSLSEAQKFWVLLNNFIEEHKSRAVIKLFRKVSPGPPGGEFMTGALAADRVLREMAKDSRSHAKGHVFFAHLLIPHSSYVFDEDGSLISPFHWQAATGEPLDDSGRLNTADARAMKYALYARQVRYLHKRLEDFFVELDKQGLYQNSRFFFMSDHGSRIYLTAPVERFKSKLSSRDMTDAFAAFLVTRDPTVKAVVHPEETFTIRVAAEFFGLPTDIRDGTKHFFQTSPKDPAKDIEV